MKITFALVSPELCGYSPIQMVQQFILLSNSLLGQIAYLQNFLGDARDGFPPLQWLLIIYSIIVVFIYLIFGENTLTPLGPPVSPASLIAAAAAAATDVRK